MSRNLPWRLTDSIRRFRMRVPNPLEMGSLSFFPDSRTDWIVRPGSWLRGSCGRFRLRAARACAQRSREVANSDTALGHSNSRLRVADVRIRPRTIEILVGVSRVVATRAGRERVELQECSSPALRHFYV